MSDFVTNVATPDRPTPPPNKHVNYTTGMVLGVDDFTQEFAYLSGRDQWLARDLLGFGTVRGLQVTVEDDGVRGPRVNVSPGVALSPRGELICIDAGQCASLNKWLDVNRARLDGHIFPFGSPLGDGIRLYVSLCYRACPVDQVPIPGEPCRSEDDAMAPSRLLDDYQLELRFEPPGQIEEDALRDFVAWLRGIEVTSALGPSTPLAEFIGMLRAAGEASPPQSPPDFMFGSPPVSLHIHPDDACDYWHAAFRVWTTELRARWTAKRQACAAPPDEGCLLLAELRVPLSPLRQVAGGASAVEIDETRRPYVLHLRLLQEWLLCSLPSTNGGGTSLTPGSSVQSEEAFGRATSVGISLDYARADHTHGTPADPITPHRLDATAHNLNGDVTGPLGTATVARIQKVPVTVPQIPQDNGKVLTLVNGQWQPMPAPAPVATNAVEHPAGLPRYFIVAAGIVRGNSTDRAPVYNGLRMKVLAAGQLHITFTNYNLPAGAHQYIVKALPVRTDAAAVPLIFFDSFQADGIVLMAKDGQTPIAVNTLNSLEWMIEVSEFFRV